MERLVELFSWLISQPVIGVVNASQMNLTNDE